ncbi:MAG: hypothetical protein R3F43_26075 [bacterium]
MQERLRRSLHADDLARHRAICPTPAGTVVTRNADCGGGEVCLYSIDSLDELTAFCGPPLGAGAPGARCVSDRGPCDAGCASGLCLGDRPAARRSAPSEDCRPGGRAWPRRWAPTRGAAHRHPAPTPPPTAPPARPAG